MARRNPAAAFFLMILEVGILTFLLSLPAVAFVWLGLPQEVPLFYVVGVFVAVGAILGRLSDFPWSSLPGAFLGGFAGYAAFTVIAPPLNLLFVAIHATLAGIAAWDASKWRSVVAPKYLGIENNEKRRCRICGARVGIRARRCWSCRASLHRIS